MIEAGNILQNRYRIEKQIGQGGMGKVFVAVDERFGSTVAIKETFFEDENLSKAFEREARLLNSLKHPALPKVSDYFTEDNGQFIVMEFIPGDDLSEIMEKTDKSFSVEEVLIWAEQLCDALKYLHTQDMPVIHRDIKPQNLKLTPNGQIILLDFGLAKGNANDASHKTQAKSIFGYSRNYASLEQIQGTGTDPQSDIYSLAATIYHLLTGIPPADALTRAMNVLNAKTDPLIPANLVNRKIPQGVAQVLQQSMALNANERPISAVEMRLMLENCDKTIDPNPTEFETDSAFAGDLLTQKTKLMSRDTNLNESDESELKTEILTKNDFNQESSVTKTARPFATVPQNSRRGVLFGGAAVSILLVIGGFALAFLLDNPAQNIKTNDDSATEITPFKNQLTTTSADSTKNEQNANTASNLVENNLPKEQTIKENPIVTNDTKASAETVKKSVDTTKSTVNNTKSSVSASDDPETFIFSTDEGKVKVVGERIETDEFIIDENGIKFKNPRKIPNFRKLPVSPEHFKKMTPQERKKLGEMVESQRKLRESERSKIAPLPIPPNQPAANNEEN